MASLDLLTVNPFTAGWRSEDQFRRQQERDLVGIDTARFDLGERQRKSSEAQAVDAVLREAAGMDLGNIVGARSQSAPDMTRPSLAMGSGDDALTGADDRQGYQVPAGYADWVKAGENPGNNPAARNPRSSAMGNSQFLEKTWLAVWPRIANDPRVAQALAPMGIDPTMLNDRNDILQMRAIPAVDAAATEELARMNAPTLRRALARDPSLGDLRLAHAFGAQGAINLLRQPDALVSDVVEADPRRRQMVMTANPNLVGKTAGDMIRQYDSPLRAKRAQQGLSLLTVGPQGDDALAGMGGRIPTAEDMALDARLSAMPEVQAVRSMDPMADMQAGGSSTGIGTMGGAGQGPDPLLSRFTDPRMQYARQRLSETPGGGQAAFGMVQNELTERDRLGLKVFEMIGAGRDQEATMLANRLGINLPPELLRNPLMRQAVADVAKIPGLQYDSTAAVRYIREYVRNGGNSAAALDAMGDPRSRADMPVGGAGAGREPAAVQTAKWLLQAGVAKDEASAWAMVSSAKTNPQQLFRSVFAAISQQKTTRGTPAFTPEEAEAKAWEIVQRVSQGGGGPAAPAAPPVGPMTPGPAMPAAPQAPQISDPLGLRR
ncbi:MAG: hypothetical protein AB7P02_06515 [Alphaproteobacteria bacterium]